MLNSIVAFVCLFFINFSIAHAQNDNSEQLNTMSCRHFYISYYYFNYSSDQTFRSEFLQLSNAANIYYSYQLNKQKALHKHIGLNELNSALQTYCSRNNEAPLKEAIDFVLLKNHSISVATENKL